MARIVIGSYAARMPVGGYLSWMLQWIEGLDRLGHEAYLAEKSGWPNSCINPLDWSSSDDCSAGTAALNGLLSRFNLQDRWCYVDAANRYHGLSKDRIEEVFKTADLFVDHMRTCEWTEESAWAGKRLLVDGEPGLTQIQMVNRVSDGRIEPDYDYYYTVGQNIGTDRTLAPSAGKQWRATYHPVVADLFPNVPPPAGAAFTTIMSWQAYKAIEFEGKTYGPKDIEFAKFMNLPRLTTAALEVAIAGKRTPRVELTGAGWRLRNANEVTMTYDLWKQYIVESRGEFSVCKNMFVETNSGWFSDRSAIYLACGRPVIMQDTGFSEHLPCGLGLFAVRTPEEAAGAIEEVNREYDRHSAAAREIAVEYLDTSRVLGKMLREIGI